MLDLNCEQVQVILHVRRGVLMSREFHFSEEDRSRTIEKLILERRTIHEYTNESVPKEIWLKALEMATWAQNHKLSQPWRFIHIQRGSREKMIELAIEVRNRKSLLSGAETESLRARYNSVPILIAVAQQKSMSFEQQREDYGAIACGLQNASLYLAALGFGSKWSTGELIQYPKTAEVLGVLKSEELIGFYWIGRPARIPAPPLRQPIMNFVRESGP